MALSQNQDLNRKRSASLQIQDLSCYTFTHCLQLNFKDAKQPGFFNFASETLWTYGNPSLSGSISQQCFSFAFSPPDFTKPPFMSKYSLIPLESSTCRQMSSPKHYLTKLSTLPSLIFSCKSTPLSYYEHKILRASSSLFRFFLVRCSDTNMTPPARKLPHPGLARTHCWHSKRAEVLLYSLLLPSIPPTTANKWLSEPSYFG